MYSRAEQSFRHFDSAGSTNAEVATALAEKMSSLFGLVALLCLQQHSVGHQRFIIQDMNHASDQTHYHGSTCWN